MTPVLISSDAEEDIEKIRVTLIASGPDMGERFHQDVAETLRYLAQFRGGLQVRSKVYRYVPLQIFRYHLIYSIEGTKVVVHRVRHMHQRPLKRYFGS